MVPAPLLKAVQSTCKVPAPLLTAVHGTCGVPAPFLTAVQGTCRVPAPLLSWRYKKDWIAEWKLCPYPVEMSSPHNSQLLPFTTMLYVNGDQWPFVRICRILFQFCGPPMLGLYVDVRRQKLFMQWQQIKFLPLHTVSTLDWSKIFVQCLSRISLFLDRKVHSEPSW